MSTPRTDAEKRKPENAGRVNGVLPTAFARQLETELNDAKAKLHALQLICGTSEASRFQTSLDRLQLQLNESREREARLEKALESVMREFEMADIPMKEIEEAISKGFAPEIVSRYEAVKQAKAALDRAASPLEQKT